MLRTVEYETDFTLQTSCGSDVDTEIKSENNGRDTQTHVQFLQKEVKEREAIIAGIENAIQILQSQLRSEKSIDSSHLR